MITQGQALAELDYSVVTGRMYRRITGTRLGKGQSGRYIEIRAGGKAYRAHRLAWLMVTGAWPTVEIDHEDLRKDNNAWHNLREADRSQNEVNKPKRTGTRSKFKHVRWDSRYGMWFVTIRRKCKVAGKLIDHGMRYFDEEEEDYAGRYAAELALRLDGEFNRPQ